MTKHKINEKGWGQELIWADTDLYCSKILVFKSIDSKTSMHFHKEKTKSWFIHEGEFKVQWIDTDDGILYEKTLKTGDVWSIPVLQPHQLISLQSNSSVFEVSNNNDKKDIFRIVGGDSQTVTKENEEPDGFQFPNGLSPEEIALNFG
jgi:mannose-6-phosphate isomerase-like protein (cupin superfamily)